jgi:hypothetical protein
MEKYIKPTLSLIDKILDRIDLIINKRLAKELYDSTFQLATDLMAGKTCVVPRRLREVERLQIAELINLEKEDGKLVVTPQPQLNSMIEKIKKVEEIEFPILKKSVKDMVYKGRFSQPLQSFLEHKNFFEEGKFNLKVLSFSSSLCKAYTFNSRLSLLRNLNEVDSDRLEPLRDIEDYLYLPSCGLALQTSTIQRCILYGFVETTEDTISITEKGGEILKEGKDCDFFFERETFKCFTSPLSMERELLRRQIEASGIKAADVKRKLDLTKELYDGILVRILGHEKSSLPILMKSVQRDYPWIPRNDLVQKCLLNLLQLKVHGLVKIKGDEYEVTNEGKEVHEELNSTLYIGLMDEIPSYYVDYLTKTYKPKIVHLS